MITGPTILTPMTLTFGAPARAHSASKIQRWAAVQSGPPYSIGHPGAPQPFLYSDFCQAMPMSGSENTDGVSACARFISGVRFSAMNSRTSFSNPRSSALKLRSIMPSCSGFQLCPPAKHGVASKVMGAATEHGVKGEQPLEVATDLKLLGDAHCAVELHRLFTDEPRALAYLGLGPGCRSAARHRLGVSHQRGAQGNRTRLVALHRHVGEPVTDHLVGGERPTKLLAHFGVFERPVEHDLHDSHGLSAERRDRAVNHRFDC